MVQQPMQDPCAVGRRCKHGYTFGTQDGSPIDHQTDSKPREQHQLAFSRTLYYRPRNNYYYKKASPTPSLLNPELRVRGGVH